MSRSLDEQHVSTLAPPARAITPRSVALGTLAICSICGMATYNDHVVANTFLIGSYLPLALVLTMFLLAVVINPLLLRFRPSAALSPGELSIVLLMTAIGCGIPTQGLFRYFLPNLVTPFSAGATNPKFWEAFKSAGLPDWLFPVPSIAEGLNQPAINNFFGRVQPGDSIPYSAWIRPLAGWSVFILAWFTSLVSVMWIFRRQWAVNERLPFPIASIEASLIAAPRPGRVLNDLLRSRLFWTGLLVVFLWQSFVALHQYFPRHVPLAPLRYNILKIMANQPWSYFSIYVKTASVYFTFIGIAYFIQSRISFSLWAGFLLAEIVTVQFRSVQSDITPAAWNDQHFGASIAFAAGFLWIGRHHIAAVGRQLIGKPGNTTLTREENYRAPAILLLCGIGALAAFFALMQVQWWVILSSVGMILLSHLITARIVAETGMPFIRSDFNANQMLTNLPAKWLSTRDLFFSAMSMTVGPISTRESAAVLTQGGLIVADRSGASTSESRRRLFLLIAWSFLLAIGVSAVAALWTHYTYAMPLAIRVQHPYLDPPAMDRPRIDMINPIQQHADGAFPTKAHSPLAHVSTGVTIAAILQWLSLRSSAWPLLPVGYLLCTTWYIQMAWFSLMLGWLTKMLILKFGGASMYQSARPLFIGAIFGEALAAGFWMLVSLTLSFAGHDYHAIPMLPS